MHYLLCHFHNTLRNNTKNEQQQQMQWNLCWLWSSIMVFALALNGMVKLNTNSVEMKVKRYFFYLICKLWVILQLDSSFEFVRGTWQNLLVFYPNHMLHSSILSSLFCWGENANVVKHSLNANILHTLKIIWSHHHHPMSSCLATCAIHSLIHSVWVSFLEFIQMQICRLEWHGCDQE